MLLKTKIERAYRRGGVLGLCSSAIQSGWRHGVRSPIDIVNAALQRRVTRPQFSFDDDVLSYLVHPYNRTWANERIVEIPIVRRFLEKHSPERVLEIGDVMNHYFPFPHDVLDKYTISRNVINKDVCEFDPSTRYDAIISISTLEHVGWDAPEVRDDTKIARAVAHLQSLLAPGGQLVFTVPTGYNTNLDSILTQNRLPLASEHYLERYSEKNEWRAASRDCALARRYGSPFPAANAILVATVC